MRIVIVGPTSLPWEQIADGVEADLQRLRRPGIDLQYRTTGAGPESIRTAEDVRAAAPHVVVTVEAAAREGADAVIVDCVDDPGVGESRRLVDTPVIGPGEAITAALDACPEPVVRLSGDDLRSAPVEDLIEHLPASGTVVVGATGFSDVAERITAERPALVVLDPLVVAVEACLARR